MNGDIPYFETSAKNNLMIDEAFKKMVEKALHSENEASSEFKIPT
jgi:hypothetical protein